MRKWAIVETAKDGEDFILDTFWTEDKAYKGLEKYKQNNLEVREMDVEYTSDDFNRDMLDGQFDWKRLAKNLWGFLKYEEKEAFVDEVVPYLE